MPRFYVDPSQIGPDHIELGGGEYNHIKNVLRKQVGDTLLICDGEGREYDCTVESFSDGEVSLRIRAVKEGRTELPVQMILFQGLPKKDKMEFIIEKAVELGATGIVPVDCARSIGKMGDDKREEKKLTRWNAIAEAAAKQSGRGMIPDVIEVKKFPVAIQYAKETCDLILLPYENAEGMKALLNAGNSLKEGMKVGIFIGPEGGFDPEEVALATKEGAVIVSLGQRILRTETAGLTILSYLMLQTEMLQDGEVSR